MFHLIYYWNKISYCLLSIHCIDRRFCPYSYMKPFDHYIDKKERHRANNVGTSFQNVINSTLNFHFGRLSASRRCLFFIKRSLLFRPGLFLPLWSLGAQTSTPLGHPLVKPVRTPPLAMVNVGQLKAKLVCPVCIVGGSFLRFFIHSTLTHYGFRAILFIRYDKMTHELAETGLSWYDRIAVGIVVQISSNVKGESLCPLWGSIRRRGITYFSSS